MRKQLSVFLSLILMFGSILILFILICELIEPELIYSLLVFHGLSIIWTFVIMIDKSRRIETRIRWVFFIIFLPLFGIVTYFYFGRKYKYKTDTNYKYIDSNDFSTEIETQNNENLRKSLDESIPQFSRAFNLAYSQQKDLIYNRSEINLLSNGADFYIDLISEIELAQEYILLNFYIIEDGELFENIKKLLIKKSKEHVRIYIIYDYVGSLGKLSKSHLNDLREHGIKIIPFSKISLPLINRSVNYRDHRKDISIDGRVGYVGGINLTDEYINMSSKFGFWNDAHYKIKGRAIQGIEKIFASDWMFCNEGFESITDYEPKVTEIRPEFEINSSNDFVQIISNGPNHKTSMHYDILLNLISNARKRIWIATPYFIPPIELLNTLKSAAISGVDVRIILPGISDKVGLLEVSKKWTDELFKVGAKIYTMNKTFSHIKTYLFDDEISFVGSTNLDFRAFFSDQQTMALVYSNDFNEINTNNFEWMISKSKHHLESPKKSKNWYKTIIVNIYNIIAPLL